MGRVTMRHEINLEGAEHPYQVFEMLKWCGVMPEESGDNLDALYDELTSIGEPVELVVSGMESSDDISDEDKAAGGEQEENFEDDKMQAFFGMLRQVFDDAECENGMLTVLYE